MVSRQLNVDIFFLLFAEFYTGNVNSPLELDNPRYQLPLELPTFPRVVPLMPSSQEIIGHEKELVQYYRQIIEKARALGRTFNEVREYFWLRLWLWNSEAEVRIAFPWYDTLAEIKNFADKLEQQEKGTIFTDSDQGWKIEVSLEDSHVTIYQDQDKEASVDGQIITVDKLYLIQQFHSCYQRAMHIIAILTETFGHDVWSEYIDDDEFMLE